MVVSCSEVWQEISNYLDGDVDSALKEGMEAHFVKCRECKTVLDGMRNIVAVYGDEKLFPLRADFQPRIERRVANRIAGTGGSYKMWVAGAGATALLAASVFLAVRKDRNTSERSAVQQWEQQSPQFMVVVSDPEKTFHLSNCQELHGKRHMVTVAEAVKAGYSPCDRCIKGALRRDENGNYVLTSEPETGSTELQTE